MNKKIKKKKVIIFLAIILFLLFIILAGNSLSKYLTQVEGKGIIQIAKWKFLVNGQTSSITNINLSKTYNKDSLKENRIAPGTKGFFDIVIDTTGSDVEIEYEVKFKNEIGKPSNLEYSYQGYTVNSICELEQYLKGNIKVDDNKKVKTLTINWMWKYETGSTKDQIDKNDNVDTENGRQLENYSFDVIVSGKQVEPIMEGNN